MHIARYSLLVAGYWLTPPLVPPSRGDLGGGVSRCWFLVAGCSLLVAGSLTSDPAKLTAGKL